MAANENDEELTLFEELALLIDQVEAAKKAVDNSGVRNDVAESIRVELGFIRRNVILLRGLSTQTVDKS